MSDNAATTRQFYEAINAGRIDDVLELIDDDFVDHEEFPGIPSTKEGVGQFFTAMHSTFDGFRMDIEDVFAGDEKVCVRATIRGTHQGEFLGVAPTGKPIEVAVVDVIRFTGDGLAVEHWGVMDALTMMIQLGALPAPAPA